MKHVVHGKASGLAAAADTINRAIGWRRYQLDDDDPGLVDWIDSVEHDHRPAIPILTSPGLWIEGAQYSLKPLGDDLWRLSTPEGDYTFTNAQVPAALQRYSSSLQAVGEQTKSSATLKEAEDALLLSEWLALDSPDSPTGGI